MMRVPVATQILIQFSSQQKKPGKGSHPARQIVSADCEVCRSLSSLNFPAHDFYSDERNP
jgi:hypothetical protein